jgi:hypothetical protein
MINNREMDKYSIVKEVVDQYDFDGLLDWGRPMGEYDIASEMISNAISEESPIEEIATISQDIFNSLYGYGHEPDSCLTLATQIKEAISTMFETRVGTPINNWYHCKPLIAN